MHRTIDRGSKDACLFCSFFRWFSLRSFRFLPQLYQERKDAEAAWASYRQLVGDLQHAVRRFNNPFKVPPWSPPPGNPFPKCHWPRQKQYAQQLPSNLPVLVNQNKPSSFSSTHAPL